MDAIAADAGVSKVTIYSHVGSKEGLFEAAVRERTERVMGGLAGVETLDPKQPRKALMRFTCAFVNRTPRSTSRCSAGISMGPP